MHELVWAVEGLGLMIVAFIVVRLIILWLEDIER